MSIKTNSHSFNRISSRAWINIKIFESTYLRSVIPFLFIVIICFSIPFKNRKHQKNSCCFEFFWAVIRYERGTKRFIMCKNSFVLGDFFSVHIMSLSITSPFMWFTTTATAMSKILIQEREAETVLCYFYSEVVNIAWKKKSFSFYKFFKKKMFDKKFYKHDNVTPDFQMHDIFQLCLCTALKI